MNVFLPNNIFSKLIVKNLFDEKLHEINPTCPKRKISY